MVFQKNFKAIFAIFMVLLIGALLLRVTGTQITSLTKADIITNRSITPGVANTNFTLAHGNLSSFDALRGLGGAVCSTGNYTTFLDVGKVQLIDNSTCCKTSDATCYVDYTYKSSLYINNGTSRELLNLTIILFAIALLVASVVLFRNQIEDLM